MNKWKLIFNIILAGRRSNLKKGCNMTAFEFFKKQYDEKKEYALKCINPEIEVDSLHFVQVASKCAFGGTFGWDWKHRENRPDDFEEMLSKKYLGHREFSSWEAKQLGKTDFYFLTVKGIKEFYKVMISGQQ